METINFKVDKQIISCDRKKLVSDTINVYKCRFSFDEEWNEYSKTAVFLKNNESVQVVLNNNECVIPQEAVNETGNLYVGVFGTNTDSRYPTIYTTPIYVAHGCQNGSDPAAPTPDVYAQILNNYNTVVSNLNTEVTRAKAREDEIEAKIPSHDNFATKDELQAETTRATQVESNKADKSTTYTKTEVDKKIAQATPTDYAQVKTQVETNKTNITTLGTTKQDVISDLETIRSGASKGNTALQSVPSEYKTKTQNDELYQDKGDYALSSDIPTKTSQLTNDSGFLTEHQDISGKVDKVTGMGLSHNDFTDTDKSDISTLKSDIVSLESLGLKVINGYICQE